MTDLDELERLAREAGKSPWYSIDSLYDAAPHNGDIAYIVAASPDVILGLIARVRSAEVTVALLSDEIRRKGLASGSAMAAHLDVELEQMKPKP